MSVQTLQTQHLLAKDDSVGVVLVKTKTNQEGSGPRDPRHLYANPLSPSRWFCQELRHPLNVRPFYNIVAKMRPQKNGAGVDHKNVINYDDVNEFFWRNSCLHFDDFNTVCTIGQSWGDFFCYGAFWTIIFVCKFMFNSVDVVLVFIYDSQIWLAIAQAIVGAWIGFRLKIDHSARIKEFVKRLQQAPNFFPAIVELCCS
ncbi:hypothetical protein F443_01825 [Phytophthora nicotianae P1569]|uniref:1,3-beta-glucan synthase component FKS1-like domain-containing protein n=1 Tax=Phytophthora nicotianae P1569 TaxID=1317065 RepID=V9FXM2_PHYNI|nr:hypothetical protein F443_01825 [Phytophthora nicotianae P1569]